MSSFDTPVFSDENLVLQAALRNDARRGLPPRYTLASVTGIASERMTVQQRLDQHIGRQHAARRAWFDAIVDRDDIIERMARQNLTGVDTKIIEAANARVAMAEEQHAAINAILLDAADKLDLTEVEDIRTAMHACLDRQITPALDDPYAEHRLTRDDCLSNLRSA